jgi:hypothetical protein
MNAGNSLVLALVAALCLAPPAAGSQQVAAVDFDVESGVFLSKLPFDVPFTIAGRALPGTTRVGLQYVEKARAGDAFGTDLRPTDPLVSGVDAEGRFRFQVGAVHPNRHFQFQVVFERQLSERGQRMFREALDGLLRRELGTTAALDAEAARTLREGIRVAFDRALSEGRPAAPARAATESFSPSVLFVASASADEVQRELQRLSRDLFAARAERAAAAARYREAVPSLLSALRPVAAAPELRTLLEALESRPELDPRNPRSALFLSPEARGLVGAPPVALESRAAGAPRDGGAADLDAIVRAEDAGAVRERQRRNAQALRELREWLQALVLPGASQRRHADALADAGALRADEVERLVALAGLGQGEIRRAEKWAESLEAYAYEVEGALSSGERALQALAARLEGDALATEVKQTLTSEAVTSAAGVYVSMDLGLLYAFEAEKGSLYLGANIYFRPINKDAPLSQRGSLGHRLSATVGVNLTNMKLADDERFENLVGERWNLLVGLGARVTRSLRVGGGALLLLKNDPNPLVSRRSLGAVPYVAVSLDVDLGRAFRGGGF